MQIANNCNKYVQVSEQIWHNPPIFEYIFPPLFEHNEHKGPLKGVWQVEFKPPLFIIELIKIASYKQFS